MGLNDKKKIDVFLMIQLNEYSDLKILKKEEVQTNNDDIGTF